MLKLGIVEYLNCFPLLFPLQNQKDLFAEIVKGAPTVLNKQFLEGNLDITPISSIEYARNAQDCLILPDVSIAADGKVLSILLVSKYEPKQLHGKKVALTSSSATSVVLLQILLKLHYNVEANFVTMKPELNNMLENADAALLIGDDALTQGLYYEDANVYDLGEVWKELTGLPMVYALWVMKERFAHQNNDQVKQVAQAMQQAKSWALKNENAVLQEAQKHYAFTPELLDLYFKTIRYDFDARYQKAAFAFYTYAHKINLLQEIPKLKIWGTVNA